jgi:hypothetical protein
VSIDYDITAEALSGLNYRRLHAGDDYDFRFNLIRNSVAFPLTGVGVKVWLTIKEASLKADADAKLQLTSAVSGEVEITDATNGRFVVKFRAGGSKGTDDLEGTWRYDLQVKAYVDGVLKVVTVAEGLIEFLPNLTRAIA